MEINLDGAAREQVELLLSAIRTSAELILATQVGGSLSDNQIQRLYELDYVAQQLAIAVADGLKSCINWRVNGESVLNEFAEVGNG